MKEASLVCKNSHTGNHIVSARRPSDGRRHNGVLINRWALSLINFLESCLSRMISAISHYHTSNSSSATIGPGLACSQRGIRFKHLKLILRALVAQLPFSVSSTLTGLLLSIYSNVARKPLQGPQGFAIPYFRKFSDLSKRHFNTIVFDRPIRIRMQNPARPVYPC